MSLLIYSVAAAYLLTGVARTTKAMGTPAIDAPLWTARPTIPRIAFNVLGWPVVQYFETYYLARGNRPRAIALTIVHGTIQLAIIASFVFGSLWLADLWTSSILFQIALSALFLMLGVLFVVPLLTLLSMPIALLLSWPIDLLFPNKR